MVETTQNAFLEAARDLRATVEAGASDDHHVPDATMHALAAAGLHAVLTPREVGGSELALRDAIDVFAEVAYADGSAGWCLMASASVTAFFGAWAGADFSRECFTDGVPLAAGQFAPNGTAIPDPDGTGFTINGDFQFGSGIVHAKWVGAGVFTQPTDGTNPDFLLALFPAQHATQRGNWDVLGLRATASEDYEVRDVHVPAGATFNFFAPVRHHGGPVYDLGVLGLTAVGHAGFAIGVTRRALDELANVATSKHRMGAPSALRDSERFLHELGTLEGRYRAARAWVHEAFGDAQHAAETGTLTPHHVNLVRQATVHATQDGADIVRHAYLLAGTTALRAGPLQRCFRDLHAGTQHFFASPAAAQDLAKDLLGRAS
ncbi:MAG: acyl-CoA dehydrogenase [Actinomycetia bacterium]|nr:acyl-CoA dehydrogenase [Actinomycetes bacterium]